MCMIMETARGKGGCSRSLGLGRGTRDDTEVGRGVKSYGASSSLPFLSLVRLAQLAVMRLGRRAVGPTCDPEERISV